jgi:nitrate/nitrite-specific signal transduction histidine kinase
MNYRASVVGGTLEIRPDEAGGTIVTCTLPSRLAAQMPPAAEQFFTAVNARARKPLPPAQSSQTPPEMPMENL